jgi:hypothetical protein
MNRATRSKHRIEPGRTVRLWNARSGQYDTFRNVTASERTVAAWAATRWISAEMGQPQRPPDFGTEGDFGWEPRVGDPNRARPLRLAPLSNVVGAWLRHFDLGDPIPPSAELPSETLSPIRCLACAVVQEMGDMFLAKFEIISGNHGRVFREAHVFESREAAGKFLDAMFSALPGAPESTLYMDASDVRRMVNIDRLIYGAA